MSEFGFRASFVIRHSSFVIDDSPTHMQAPESALNIRPPFDPLLEQIAAYVSDARIASEDAYNTARYCLMDTLGCGLLALNYPACTKLLGPIVPATVVP